MNVLVLNGEDIGSPETLAMLQAFYSRSPMSIRQRLKTLNGDESEIKEEKIKAALKRYYLDYGHASIADCGDAVVFVEGISMLAAKVIQDDPLYNGQECSTRYLDFSAQPFRTDRGTNEEQEIVEDWRQLYLAYLPKAKEWARKTYSSDKVVSAKIAPENVQAAFEKTCDAIAFDIVRSLLPCGATTNVAWKGSLRRLRDRCKEMAYHPLSEVRLIGERVNDMLWAKHPNSFKPSPLNENGIIGPVANYYNVFGSCLDEVKITSRWCPEVGDNLFNEHQPREDYEPLRRFDDHGSYFQIQGQIDFGSARDLLRHRPGLNQLPLVGNWGHSSTFNHWYGSRLQEIDSSLYGEVMKLFSYVITYPGSAVHNQYLFPLGTNVDVNLIWNLGQLRYVLPLRTKTTVHPTLRQWMTKLHTLVGGYGHGIEIDTRDDYEASDRGEQTIKERTNAPNT